MPSGSKPSRIPVYKLALLLLLLKREAFARSLDTEENATGRRSTRNGIRDDHGKKDSAGDVKEVELVKDYTGWRMLRLFPPSASVLEQVVSSFEVDPEVVILGVFRTPQLAVDVTIPPTKSLETILSHAHLPSLCSLDGNDAHYLKDSISPSRIARLCNEKTFASGRENPNSKSFLGWRTLDDFLSPGSPRQDNETEPLSWIDYHRYDSMVMFVKDLAAEYPTVEYLEVGRSVEGRPLLALIFSIRPAQMVKQYHKSILKIRRSRNRTKRHKELRHKKRTNKKKKNTKTFVFIEAGIHAREWISPAVATNLAQQLADAGKKFLRRVTVVIAPMANPDGYEFSHTTDRMWRKNRRETSNPECKGVDLNRNWAMAWGSSGSSSDPCSQTYRGSAAFSEPETTALRDLALTWIDEISLFLSLHSYGNFVLHPWSYSVAPSSKERQLKKLGKRIRNHLKRNGYREFRGGQTGDVLYEASGTSEDYMHNAGVKYAYTIELPRYSFILDPSNIVPLSKAVWRTLVCTIGLIAKEESVMAFCKKKIVKVQLKNGQTVSGWFDKNLPLDEAEQFIMERYNTTERNIGKYDGKRKLFLYDLR